jgi:hypothetical protein
MNASAMWAEPWEEYGMKRDIALALGQIDKVHEYESAHCTLR